MIEIFEEHPKTGWKKLKYVAKYLGLNIDSEFHDQIL